MVSYFKTQWWRLLIALFCFGMACYYALQPAGELTVEGLDYDLGNMISAICYFISFLIWSFTAFIDYNSKRIELLEKKQERDDKMYELVQELVKANEIDRKLDTVRDQKIKKLEEK